MRKKFTSAPICAEVTANTIMPEFLFKAAVVLDGDIIDFSLVFSNCGPGLPIQRASVRLLPGKELIQSFANDGCYGFGAFVSYLLDQRGRN